MANRKIAQCVFLGLAGATIVACSAATSPDEAPSSDTAEALGASGVQACAASTSYLVIALNEGRQAAGCPSVSGRGGTWEYAGPPVIPACTPTTAPASSAPFVCSYEWTPDHPPAGGAAPDVGALDAIPGVFVAAAGGRNGGEGTCTDSSYLPYVALMDQAGVRCPNPGGPPNGPRQCDVCGATVFPGVAGSQLWIPSWSDLHTIVVRLSNGSHHVLTVGPSTQRGAAAHRTRGSLVEIKLPRLPHGVSYVDGPALGYGYKSH